MNRNSEYNFAQNPQVGVSRSRFQRNSDNKTTFNTGELIPIYLDEVLPGDTHEIDMACVMRMATPIFPVMDNAFCDFYFFFVPNRLLWEHWKEFMGENKETAWAPKTEYSIPQVTAPAEGWAEGTLADYLGLPTKVKGISVSALPGRAYGLIYNEWFRNQNVTQPTLVEVTDATTTGKNDGSATNDSAITLAKPLKAAKVFDYYTGALPEPQKGEPITIPLSGNAPIKTYLDEEMTKPATSIKKGDTYSSPWTWGGNEAGLIQSESSDAKMRGATKRRIQLWKPGNARIKRLCIPRRRPWSSNSSNHQPVTPSISDPKTAGKRRTRRHEIPRSTARALRSYLSRLSYADSGISGRLQTAYQRVSSYTDLFDRQHEPAGQHGGAECDHNEQTYVYQVLYGTRLYHGTRSGTN